jgi:hypothetical protein
MASLRKMKSIILKSKKASLMQEVIMHIILITLIFGLFYTSTMGRVNSRAVKQQVLEKQTALLIDSAVPGMSFSVSKVNRFGYVSGIEATNGRVSVYVDGLKTSEGYAYFSRYNIDIKETQEAFVIIIK